MKIGILTFHRAHNYGAVLQCYALQEVLEKMGHDVEVVDYRQKWTEDVYKIFSFNVLHTRYHNIIGKLRYVKGVFKRIKPYKKSKTNYAEFRNRFLKVSNKYTPSKMMDYDACIVGSDQLWGINCLGNKPDSVFMGNFQVKVGCKKIAYAISSNIKSIDYFYEHNILSDSISNFDFVSFREQIVLERIAYYTQQSYQQCIDPTLLTTEELWRSLLDDSWTSRNYIVCYRARGNGNSGFSLERIAEELANELFCEVIDLTSNQYSVVDFVSAIANAKYVVTTSFHATVFALIFRRPLAAYLLHDGYDSRYEDLLRKVDASQFAYETFQLPRVRDYIDWDNISIALSNYRKSSLEYLKKAIG